MSKRDFAVKYGPTALVTGGAQGIGRAFAFSLAKRGVALLLVDMETEILEKTATEIRSQYAIDVSTVAADLTDAAGLDSVIKSAAKTTVGLLVSNAGYGLTERFLDSDLERHLNVVDLNVRAPLVLAHNLLPAMQERRRGGVIFTSSLSAVIGTPGVASYSASKGFLLKLGEALYGEMHHKGVDVLALMPGLTRTAALTAATNLSEASKAMAMEPEAVAEAALRALGKGPSIIPGLKFRLAGFLIRWIPQNMILKRQGKASETQRYSK